MKRQSFMTWCATPGTGADEAQHLAEHERLTRAGRGRASHHTIKDRASHRARERACVRREMVDCLPHHRAHHLRSRDTLRHSEALSRHSLGTRAALSALSRHSLGGALLPRGTLPCHRSRQPSVSCFRMGGRLLMSTVTLYHMCIPISITRRLPDLHHEKRGRSTALRKSRLSHVSCRKT